MATLLIQMPNGASELYPLTLDRSVLGRAKEASIVVPARGVSREHCEILLKDGRFILNDLESKNGTFVNDQSAKSVVLHNNDVITLGEARLTFFRDDADAKAEAARREASKSHGIPGQGGPTLKTSPSGQHAAQPIPAGGNLGGMPGAGRRMVVKWVESESAIIYQGTTSQRAAAAATPAPIPPVQPPSESPSDQLKHAHDELRRSKYFNEVLQELTEGGDLQDCYEAVANRLNKSFRFERVFVLIPGELAPIDLGGGDPDGTAAIPRNAASREPALLFLSDKSRFAQAGTGLRYSSKAIAQVRHSMAPLLVSIQDSSTTIGGTAPFNPSASYLETGATKSMLAPIIYDGKLQAILQADTMGTTPRNDLGEKEMGLFASIADALAVMMRRAAKGEAGIETGKSDQMAITLAAADLPPLGLRKEDCAILIIKAVPPFGTGMYAVVSSGGTPSTDPLAVSPSGPTMTVPQSNASGMDVTPGVPSPSSAPASSSSAAPPSAGDTKPQALVFHQFLQLAAESIRNHNASIELVSNLGIVAVFRASQAKAEPAVRAADAAAAFLVTHTGQQRGWGGNSRPLPQAAAVVTYGEVSMFELQGAPQRGSLTAFGAPYSRALQMAEQLAAGQLLVDAAAARKLAEGTSPGSIEDVPALGVAWRQLQWRPRSVAAG